MTRFLIYLLIIGIGLYYFSRWSRQRMVFKDANQPAKPPKWLKAKRNPSEPWVQVYETASMDEARVLLARLQEEDVECILYEQGKKDIYGNAPKGIGLAVPKTSTGLAQTIISRLLS